MLCSDLTLDIVWDGRTTHNKSLFELTVVQMMERAVAASFYSPVEDNSNSIVERQEEVI